MTKIEQVLNTYFQISTFISLVESIEDRSDPRSKWHNYTVNEILNQVGLARATFYDKRRKYFESGIDGLRPKKRGPKSTRLPGQIQGRIEELRDRGLSARSISSMVFI